MGGLWDSLMNPCSAPTSPSLQTYPASSPFCGQAAVFWLLGHPDPKSQKALREGTKPKNRKGQFADGETQGRRTGSDLAEAKQHYRGQVLFLLGQDCLHLDHTNLISVPKKTILGTTTALYSHFCCSSIGFNNFCWAIAALV